MHRASLSLFVAAFAVACNPIEVDEIDDPVVIEAHAPDGEVQTVSLALRRLSAKGPYIAGATEKFELVVQGEITGRVDWSASSGSLHSDEEVVSWTLPTDRAKASLTVAVTTLAGEAMERSFAFGISGGNPPGWLVDPAAQGLVDPTPNSVGDCRMAIDASDVPHIVYRNETHLQLWYATWDGAAWDLDMIDGPGFDTGGAVSNQIDFLVEDDGTPHVAYRYDGSSDVRYATLTGPTWTRELANPSITTTGTYGLSIALDPVNGNRPTIAFNNNTSSYPRPGVTYRTGPDTWVDTSYTLTNDWWDDYSGGLAFDSTGMAWLVYEPDDLHVLNWSASGGFSGDADITDSGYGTTARTTIALDSTEDPIVMHEEGVEHLLVSGWNSSDYEAGDTTLFDLAVDGGSPRLAVRHSSNLEFLDIDPEGFWAYTQIDSMDSSDRPSVAVDASSVTHACYIKDSEVWFY